MRNKEPEGFAAASDGLGEFIEEYNTNSLSPHLKVLWVQAIGLFLLVGLLSVCTIGTGERLSGSIIPTG